MRHKTKNNLYAKRAADEKSILATAYAVVLGCGMLTAAAVFLRALAESLR